MKTADKIRGAMERAARELVGVSGAHVSVCLPDGHGELVREIAEAWGVEFRRQPHGTSEQIVSAWRYCGGIDGVSMTLQSTVRLECVKCGDVLKDEPGADFDTGVCVRCEGGRMAEAAQRAAEAHR